MTIRHAQEHELLVQLATRAPQRLRLFVLMALLWPARQPADSAQRTCRHRLGVDF